ncbi:MAG: DUF5069 domain-containing protein [Verrucomicrobia bacterium]|nr:DUF5069 domain-containing protein [Verrucomicrobiota bacterium]
MKHYTYQKKLQAIWQKAVDLYQAGNRDGTTYFDDEESNFLASIGANAQEIFDFAEDYVSGGEPDFTTVAIIHDIRRAYFQEVQKGLPSEEVLDPTTLPAKDTEAEGIRWLPRIIQKAKAKLRGELHPDVMYSCGGDRHFLKENDVHAGEFLRIVWENWDHEDAIVDWVVRRIRGDLAVAE